jgi:hypothetical protein
MLQIRVTRLGEFSPIGSLIVLDRFFENYRISRKFFTTIFQGKNYELILIKLGFPLGDFSQTHHVTLMLLPLQEERNSNRTTVDRRPLGSFLREG